MRLAITLRLRPRRVPQTSVGRSSDSELQMPSLLAVKRQWLLRTGIVDAHYSGGAVPEFHRIPCLSIRNSLRNRPPTHEGPNIEDRLVLSMSRGQFSYLPIRPDALENRPRGRVAQEVAQLRWRKRTFACQRSRFSGARHQKPRPTKMSLPAFATAWCKISIEKTAIQNCPI